MRAEDGPRREWACDRCVHMLDSRYVKGSGRITQYTCGLNGRKYGNVKSCPYREVVDDGSEVDDR